MSAVRDNTRSRQKHVENLIKISVGGKYLVQWKSGQKYIGEIIEKRPIRRLHDKQDSSSETLGSIADEAFEYYVHYVDFDRRLDEWVSIDKIEECAINNHDDHDNHAKNKKIKRKFDDIVMNTKEEKASVLMQLEKEHEEITKVKNIQTIQLGKYEIDTWYFSPYPDEYCGEDKLILCEFCLKYMKKPSTLARHKSKCGLQHPPGRLIYRDNSNLSMFEIDGQQSKIYCQNLCLLSKLFLDHKTLYYDVDSFLFYVLCEVEVDLSSGHECHHVVGYFSKEKLSLENYNLACILTFPPYQRKGYGKFLISISYELTKRESTTGSPEKPLSDLGKISYRSYWAHVILNMLKFETDGITVQEIARKTGIKVEDILSTLHAMNLIKYWKGQHVISITQSTLDNHTEESSRFRLCNPVYLNWQPPEKSSKGKIS